MSERVLDITTLGVAPALPAVLRIAWERHHGDGYHCRPGAWSFAQTTIQLTLIGGGAVWPAGGGAGRPLPPGRALLYSNRAHRELAYGLADAATPWEFLYVNLVGSAAAAMVADLARLHEHVAPLSLDAPVVRDCLALLPARGHRHRPWPLAESTALAQRLLLALSGAPAAGSGQEAGDSLVALAMHELERRLGEPWTIARLAREVGVSREHLSRAFLARTGLPPAAWLRQRRVAAACRLLRGGHAVAEVARTCGFPDAAHFARVFRQGTGMTPRRFRDHGGTAF